MNGQQVGMTKASKTPAEFNVTNYLKEGENLLAVQIYRWHDGSYMEDQDFWRLTGIERDVFLQAYPKLTIWDFFLKSSLDSTYKNGIFNATVDLREFTGNNVKKGTLKLELLDKTGKIVLSQQKKFDIEDEFTQLAFRASLRMYPNGMLKSHLFMIVSSHFGMIKTSSLQLLPVRPVSER